MDERVESNDLVYVAEWMRSSAGLYGSVVE